MGGKFIPPHDGYGKLLSFQRAEVVYDAIVHPANGFTDRFTLIVEPPGFDQPGDATLLFLGKRATHASTTGQLMERCLTLILENRVGRGGGLKAGLKSHSHVFEFLAPL